MTILLRLVVAWLAPAWSGSAAARDAEVLPDAPGEHVTIGGPAVRTRH
jgi:hypothetical protein